MPLEDNSEYAFAAFKSCFMAGRLANAYLIVGDSRGNAKRLAERMIALLYCRSSEMRPCGKCTACHHIYKHTHPDLMWVEPQKKSRTIQLEQVQAIQEHAFQTSFEGGWRSVILMYADRLNDVASNRLLKTLEEPPAKTIFLLLTDMPNALLPTIVSRCQRIVLFHGSMPDNTFLQKRVIDVLKKARGKNSVMAITRAQMLLELLKNMRKEIEADERKQCGLENANGELTQDLKIILQARIEARYRENRTALLRWLLYYYRDILLCVCSADEKFFYFRNQADYIRSIATGLSLKQALANIQCVEEMKSQLDQYLPETTVLEHGMIQLNNVSCSA